MAFCKPCQGIIPGVLNDNFHQYKLFPDAHEMLRSRKDCVCCDIILAAVRQNNEDETYPCYPNSLEQWDCWYFEDHLDRDRVLVKGLGGSSFPRTPEDTTFHLTGLEININVEGGSLIGYLGVYDKSGGSSVLPWSLRIQSKNCR